MGDLRDDWIRLAERLAVGVICTRNEFDANPHCATPSVRQRLAALAEDAIALRALLARHPAPSPSVSRDAETKVIDAARRIVARWDDETPMTMDEYERWEAEDERRLRSALAALDAAAPSPRSEAESGPCCVDRARRGWCDCARAPATAESATKGEEDGR